MITGVAQNQNPVVIREVRVAGQLYNLEGKEIEQQIIWIGNAISPRIIRGMTVQDISDLQRLKPLKTFEIPPGDSIPFTIVFLKSTQRNKKLQLRSPDSRGRSLDESLLSAVFAGVLFWRDIDLVRFFDSLAKLSNGGAKTFTQVGQPTVE